MKIETVIDNREAFFAAFPHYASSDLEVIPEQVFGACMAAQWEERIDDLVLWDLKHSPESYNTGSQNIFRLFANPLSVHVGSARRVYERVNTALRSGDEVTQDFPEVGSDQDLRERYLYDVGMYAEDMIGDSEWFTICGSWEETFVSALFGYAPADPKRMVVLFS